MRAAPSKRTTATSPGVRLTRLILGAAGVAGIAYGAGELLTHLTLWALVGLLGWLAGAVVLHDGVLVPLTTLAGGGLKRITFGLGTLQQAIIRGALLCGAVMTLIAAPLLKARAVLQPGGPASAANRTILDGAYGTHLALLWLGLALVAAVAVAGVGLYGRRKVTKTRP